MIAYFFILYNLAASQLTTTDILESESPYAKNYGGTSVAAPLVCGVIALMLGEHLKYAMSINTIQAKARFK